jgi:hypothetical protein
MRSLFFSFLFSFAAGHETKSFTKVVFTERISVSGKNPEWELGFPIFGDNFGFSTCGVWDNKGKKGRK